MITLGARIFPSKFGRMPYVGLFDVATGEEIEGVVTSELTTAMGDTPRVRVELVLRKPEQLIYEAEQKREGVDAG